MRSALHAYVLRLLTAIRGAAVGCLIATLAITTIPPAATFAADTVSSDQAEIVKANNAFAVDLYGQLRSQPGNLFFSPESISTALAMTYAGAHVQTATEMANVLHFTLPPERLHPAMAALLKERNASHDGYQLKEADALWGQQGYAFLPEFLKLTSDNYGAGFNQVNFADSEAARHTINQWVEQQTEQKIKDLIGQGVLDTKTRLVLTNAIYFKGNWETQFKKEETMQEDFHVSSSDTIKVPMMHRDDTFNYLDGGSFQALELPYKNTELSMIIFLPKAVDGLAAFEQPPTLDKVEPWLGQLRSVPRVIVTIPKFKMEAQFGLKDMLQAMGMRQAFLAGPADFTGIASPLPHETGLYISAVIHKAFVDVNEEGTEAAAATAVNMGAVPTTAATLPLPPIIFRADHPFLFLIRDNKSGSILFMGRVTKPDR